VVEVDREVGHRFVRHQPASTEMENRGWP